MAIRSLPVLDQRPRVVGDCVEGARPCPWVSCRFNLLVDQLEDGSLVLNAPSSRLKGATRPFPNRHEADRQWFVVVTLPAGDSDARNAVTRERDERRIAAARASAGERGAAVLRRAGERGAKIVATARTRCGGLKERTPGTRAAEKRQEIARGIMRKARDRAGKIRDAAARKVDAMIALAVERAVPRGDRIYALGPCDSAARAGEVSAAWEAEHGAGTTSVLCDLAPRYEQIGKREGDVDAKFLDEAEDAVDYWFDEPDPNLPSCLLDEIAKLYASGDERPQDDYLLEQISKLLYVSRERTRQVEVAALLKVKRLAEELDLDPAEILSRRE